MTPGHQPPDPPLAWLWAQQKALALITRGEPGWQVACFEHRAAHDVLALTLMLGGAAAAHSLTTSDQGDFPQLLADDIGWAVWCQRSLDDPPAGLTAADIDMARSAWRWLTRSVLLAGSVVGPCARGVAYRPGMGVPLGVAKARQAAGMTGRRAP